MQNWSPTLQPGLLTFLGCMFPHVLQDSEPVTALTLSPDSRLLFSASRSLQQRCWSMETGQAIRSFKVRACSCAVHTGAGNCAGQRWLGCTEQAL